MSLQAFPGSGLQAFRASALQARGAAAAAATLYVLTSADQVERYDAHDFASLGAPVTLASPSAGSFVAFDADPTSGQIVAQIGTQRLESWDAAGTKLWSVLVESGQNRHSGIAFGAGDVWSVSRNSANTQLTLQRRNAATGAVEDSYPIVTSTGLVGGNITTLADRAVVSWYSDPSSTGVVDAHLTALALEDGDVLATRQFTDDVDIVNDTDPFPWYVHRAPDHVVVEHVQGQTFTVIEYLRLTPALLDATTFPGVSLGFARQIGAVDTDAGASTGPWYITHFSDDVTKRAANGSAVRTFEASATVEYVALVGI